MTRATVPDHLLAPYRHTCRRLRERYGVILGPVGYLRLCAELAGQGHAAPDTHQGRVIVLHQAQGRHVRLVFSVPDACVVTALLSEAPRKSRASHQRERVAPNGSRRKVRQNRPPPPAEFEED